MCMAHRVEWMGHKDAETICTGALSGVVMRFMAVTSANIKPFQCSDRKVMQWYNA